MRKKYLVTGIILGGILFSILIVILTIKKSGGEMEELPYHEASFYQSSEGGMVQCGLCPNRCLLREGQRGICKARENIKGKLYSLVYGQVTITAVDPIEKKPLYHFLPGAKAYSLSTSGCNLSCKYCQNWDIAQRQPEEVDSKEMTPEEVVDDALKSGSPVIAFTYNEPVVWFEYMLDIAKLAKQKGLRTVMISNGYINEGPLKELLGYLDAVKVDLKSFDDNIYQEMTTAKLAPVLETIKTVHDSGQWLEIVYLVVPGYTDDFEKIKEMCSWIRDNVGENVPVHFSRFWPKYKLINLPPTPEEVVKKAREICQKEGLKYVYTGNIEDEAGNNTYCPQTQNPVIKREGFFIKENLVDELGKASNCSATISGVWQ